VGPRSADGAQWNRAVECQIQAFCAAREMVSRVEFDGKATHFAIDNPFDLIQRHHIGGKFFETLELTELSGFVGRGKVIAEVGANVGNHLVFYAQHMGAKTIIPFEPNPDAIRLLDRNIKANALDGVIDRRGIGFGAGAEYGKFSVVLPQDNNLGAARLEAGSGELEVRPLDDMLAGVDIDFMKIDVEGMEFDVLEGAKKVIARCRPTMMIEVVRSRIPEFEDWCRTYAYDIAKVYNNVHAANFVVTAH
jgi:FkbM family methyltransferase